MRGRRKVELELGQAMAQAVDDEEDAVHEEDRQLLKVRAEVRLGREALDRHHQHVGQRLVLLELRHQVVVLAHGHC